MSNPSTSTLLKGAHVVDPSQGIDGIFDVLITDGKIAGVGSYTPVQGQDVVDLQGLYLSPGWIDIHVHTYGTLGFGDPDSIGIYQGVTTYVDAGGSGIEVLDEFLATMEGLDTELYAGAFIRPIGMVGLDHVEDELRSINNVPLLRWLEFTKQHPGLIRYLKMGAFHEFEYGALKFGKGLAMMLGLPLYVHIGEFRTENTNPQLNLQAACETLEKGDFITHIYHGNPGGILDENGRVYDYVKDAQARGVIFDIGFGGNNFSWQVGEAAYEQGLVPRVISSDLQQYNVMGPTYSLANVMTIFRRLGLSVSEVIQRVTEYAAQSINLPLHGTLAKGAPADITVFQLERDEFDLLDCKAERRTARERFVPVAAYKRGVRFETDLARSQVETNWLVIPTDGVPEAATTLTVSQRNFLFRLADELATMRWDSENLEYMDLSKPALIKVKFEQVRSVSELSLKEALNAVYDSFGENRFSIQVGLFLVRQEQGFALERLREVAGQPVSA